MKDKSTWIGVAVIVAVMVFINSKTWYHLRGYKHPSEVTVTADTSAAPDRDSSVTAGQSGTDSMSVDSQIHAAHAAADTSVRSGDSLLPRNPEDSGAVRTPETFVIENSVLSLSLTENGAAITSARALKYSYREDIPQEGIISILDTLRGGIGQISLGGTYLGDHLFTYDSARSDSMQAVFSTSFQGKTIEKIFALQKDSYYIDFSVRGEALDGTDIAVEFPSGPNETEDPHNMGTRLVPREYTLYDAEGKVHVELHKDITEETFTDAYRWVGNKAKYFGYALIFAENTRAEVTAQSYAVDPSAKIGRNNINYALTVESEASGDEQNYSLFMGPSKLDILKEAGVELDKMVFRGWHVLWLDTVFPALCNFVLWVMGGIFSVFGDYGVAILGITLLMKLITFPLTQSSLKSMKQMKDIQPKIRAIQDKYKKDPQVMQAKLMEFYKTNNINPLAGLGGCLPMFLQMPVMLSLFVVPRKAIELRGEDTILAPWLSDLSQPGSILDLPFDIPFYGDHIALLPIIASVLMFFQNKDNIKDPQQRSMVIMMPVIMLVMFNNFPSGLTLYFVFSTLFQFLQQKLVNTDTPKVKK